MVGWLRLEQTGMIKRQGGLTPPQSCTISIETNRTKAEETSMKNHTLQNGQIGPKEFDWFVGIDVDSYR